MTKKNGVNYSMQSKVILRRKSVIERLEKQLISKVKNTSEGIFELTSGDINRIQKEISILKTRI